MHHHRLPALRRLTYVTAFFLTFHGAFSAYINSAFLSSLVPENFIGIIYALAAILGIIGIHFASQLAPRVGTTNLFTFLALINFFVTLYLTRADTGLSTVIAFMAFYVIAMVLKPLLDIYLEQLSTDEITGGIRSLFITAINLAWLISPFFASRLIINNQYQEIFFVSAVVLVPAILLGAFKLKAVPESTHRHITILATIGRFFRQRRGMRADLRHILEIDFLLNFFYAVMVIYTPLYLFNHLGFDWPTIGKIFTWMLLPFVLLEIPLGKIADAYLGEKEILVAGLAIMGLFTIMIPFVGHTALAWTVVLVGTRIGAASVEIMKETYLFKQINEADTDVITFSRIMVPLTVIIAPICVSIFLWFGFPFVFLYLPLGFLVLLGLLPAARLHDTK